MKLEEVYDYFENELPELLRKLPLGEEKFIGIYGMGVHTERLLQRYQADVGIIKAKLIFIDSKVKTLSVKYHDCDVYNIRDIKILSLDAIILSSSLYENEMYQMILELYGNKFSVYRFYELDGEDIFLREGIYLEKRDLPVLKINFADCGQIFDIKNNYIVRILLSRYKLEISENPDILICSHFGENYKNYKECKKIFMITEPPFLWPYNLKNYDYAIGYPYIENEHFLHYNSYRPLDTTEIQDRREFSDYSYAKRKFCNFIYSNASYGGGAFLRQQFCTELSKYKHIDCPGKVLNNMKNVIDNRENCVWWESKLTFIKKYKFTIAFENSKIDGYTTEKLWHPLKAGSIPIYWGNPLIGKEIHSEAFINCNEYDNDFNAIIERVKEIDKDDEYYMYMLSKSPLKDSVNLEMEKLRSFLNEICESIEQ